MTRQEKYELNRAIMQIVSDPNGEVFNYLTDYSLSMPILLRAGIDTRQIRSATHETIEVRHCDESKGDTISFIKGFNRDMVTRPVKPGEHNGMFLSKTSTSDSAPRYSIKTSFLAENYLESAFKCFLDMNEKTTLRHLFYNPDL
jgi:hypothetical protein